MLVNAYRSPITKSILIYKEFGAVNEEIASCVLKFSLSVIRTLQIQLGSPYISEMLDIFLKTTTRYMIYILMLIVFLVIGDLKIHELYQNYITMNSSYSFLISFVVSNWRVTVIKRWKNSCKCFCSSCNSPEVLVQIYCHQYSILHWIMCRPFFWCKEEIQMIFVILLLHYSIYLMGNVINIILRLNRIHLHILLLSYYYYC